MGGDVVEAVFADPESAPVSERVKAALRLVERCTLHPEDLDRADVVAARAAGLSDRDIAEVVDVTTVFNLMNRLSDAFGFKVFSAKEFRRGAKLLTRIGYRFPRILWPLG